jgi:NADPH:quinone reductase-like Zn-dependent oxidoreductase
MEKPIPEPNQMLVKVRATTVCAGDVRLRSSDFPSLYWLIARLIFGLVRPKKRILGHEFSGIVEKTGEKVNGFTVGDEVFGTTTMLKSGSYAEYVCIPQHWKHGVIALKPSSLSHIESSALPIGAMAALFLLEKAKVRSGQKVLIYGASGSVGTYAIQLSIYFNTQVTAVCSTTNIEMVKNLGAKHIVDYLQEDYTLLQDRFDIVFDAVGKVKKTKTKEVLKPNGRFVSVKMMTKEKISHFHKIKALAENGKIKPVIDKVYRFDQMVQAHYYVDKGRKKGNVVIAMD